MSPFFHQRGQEHHFSRIPALRWDNFHKCTGVPWMSSSEEIEITEVGGVPAGVRGPFFTSQQPASRDPTSGVACRLPSLLNERVPSGVSPNLLPENRCRGIYGCAHGGEHTTKVGMGALTGDFRVCSRVCARALVRGFLRVCLRVGAQTPYAQILHSLGLQVQTKRRRP